MAKYRCSICGYIYEEIDRGLNASQMQATASILY